MLQTTRCEQVNGPGLSVVCSEASRVLLPPPHCRHHVVTGFFSMPMLDLVHPSTQRDAGILLYTNGCHALPLQVVKWLWDIVRELHPDDQRRFLKFFTGSDRAPIGGLGNLRCIIQRDGPDSNKLPTSHTCFNTLLLPSYVSRLKMEERLRLAIDWSAQGFGLE